MVGSAMAYPTGAPTSVCNNQNPIGNGPHATAAGTGGLTVSFTTLGSSSTAATTWQSGLTIWINGSFQIGGYLISAVQGASAVTTFTNVRFGSFINTTDGSPFQPLCNNTGSSADYALTHTTGDPKGKLVNGNYLFGWMWTPSSVTFTGPVTFYVTAVDDNDGTNIYALSSTIPLPASSSSTGMIAPTGTTTGTTSMMTGTTSTMTGATSSMTASTNPSSSSSSVNNTHINSAHSTASYSFLFALPAFFIGLAALF